MGAIAHKQPHCTEEVSRGNHTMELSSWGILTCCLTWHGSCPGWGGQPGQVLGYPPPQISLDSAPMYVGANGARGIFPPSVEGEVLVDCPTCLQAKCSEFHQEIKSKVQWVATSDYFPRSGPTLPLHLILTLTTIEYWDRASGGRNIIYETSGTPRMMYALESGLERLQMGSK